ncbi:MAG: glycosyltransferase family 39 protein, partial [Candidatus Krumholzibacteriia bacterium]
MTRRPRPRPSAAPHQLPRLVLALVLACGAVALAASAWLRPIDGDEGYYAAAAGLTAAGARPYADYFYPQAPLLPWVYAPVVAAAGPSLRALRWLSAALALATVLVWAWHLVRTRGAGSWLAPACVAVLVCSPGVVSWAVTVKTYALTNLLASLALVALARGLEPGAGRRWLAGAGLALGLAASTR